jgi:hypothetical protein
MGSCRSDGSRFWWYLSRHCFALRELMKEAMLTQSWGPMSRTNVTSLWLSSGVQGPFLGERTPFLMTIVRR